MGSKTSSQTNQQSTTTADPQAAADYTGVINRARQVSKTPYTAYSGELTAPVNAQENLATGALNGLGAAANSTFGQAAQQSGLGAAAVNPSNVGLGAINRYMSPYQSDVINSTTALLNQQDQIQQQQQTGAAIGAGAFGGDRAGVAAAALAGQQDLANNSTIAGLENQNYSQALSEANTQQQVGLGAAQANRAAVQQNAATLAGIGSAQTSAGLGVANAQLGAGALQQQTQQASDTAQYGQFLQKEAYPFQTEQYLADIVGGIAPNYGSSTEGTSQTETSPLNSILGGAAVAGALAPSLSGLSSIGTGIGSFFGLSDRRAKENIRKIGKTFDHQPIYAFNYKGRPPEETELGLVAQEVEKKHPGAVQPGLGHLKYVDYDAATRAAADKGHFARGGRAAAGLGGVRYHDLTREEVAHLDNVEPHPRATGGVVGPYADAQGYVPTSQGLGVARTLSSPLPAPSQPTSPIPSFTQFTQAGQGLGAIGTGLGNATSGLGNAASSVSNYVSGGMNSEGLFNFAEGGRVKGLGLAAAALPRRRGYDGGGVVPADDLVFDPSAVGPAQTLQAGLGAAAIPAGFTPAPTSQGLGVVAAAAPQGSPQGLGFAAQNDNAPVPVAPAPVMTPVVGYQQADGTVTPTAGLGNLPKPPTPPGGVMGGVAPEAGLGAPVPQSAPAAIDDATAPRSVRNNNPGNIEDGPFARNMPGYSGSDGRFAIFDTPANGAGAMDGLLDRYGRQGLVTPMQIISKWSPAGDGSNDPTAYAGTVARTLGIGVNDPIDMTNPTQRAALARAMANVEAGSGRGVTAGIPSSALGYTSGGLGGGSAGLGLGSAQSQPVGSPSGLGYASTAAAGLGATDTSTPKKGLGSVLGFGPGGDGGLFGLNDDARAALMSFGAGMAASPSKSPGIAFGQGVSQAVQTSQNQQQLGIKRAQAQGELANMASEAAYRQGSLGIDSKRVDLGLKEFELNLANTQKELALRSQEVANQTAQTKAQTGLQQAETADKLQTFGPQGLIVRDPNNLNAPPKLVPYSTLQQGSGDGGSNASGQQPQATDKPVVDPSGYVHPPTKIPMNPMLFSPEGRAAAAENAKPTMDSARTAYEASQGQKFTLDQMQHEFSSLPSTGFLAAGPGQQERAHAVNSINSVLRTLGVGNDGLIDPKSTGATEDLKKLTVRMGQDLAKTLGGREPGFIVQQSVGAVPSSENSPMGFQRITAGLRAAAQRNEDRFNWLTEWQKNAGGDITGADDAFNKANPPSRYVGQAVLSTVPPSAITYLRQHHEARDQFDTKFGSVTSNYVLGQ